MVRQVEGGDQLFGREPDGRVVDPDLIDGGLRSKQFATVLDLLGYGQIDGILDGGGAGSSTFRKNIFLDNTPLQNPLGDENFTDVEVFVKDGASNQTALKEINAIENTIPVGVALTNSPFTSTKTGTYILAGGGGQDVTVGSTSFRLQPNQMVVAFDSAHGYSIGEVIHWANTTSGAVSNGKTLSDFPQTQNILPENFATNFFVVNTTFDDNPFAGACTVKTSQGLSRTISNTDVDKIRVSIQIPSLQEFKDDGDVVGAEVKISIRIIENTGTINNPVILDVTNGKATSPYVKDFELTFERTMNFPLTLSVFRNTDDGTDTKLQNSTNWLSYTEINTDTSAYQGFAYVALRFNAQEFKSYPRRMYRVKGTKIKVPHGTTVDSDNGRVIYPSGYTFNGTFKTDKEWCSDPAWVLYDILTTDKGFGGDGGIIQEENLDVFSFYSASAYASALITDPITKTTEPRFSTNIILNTRNDAYTLINDLCSVMNAIPFYSNGSLQISQDRPTNVSTNTSDPEYIFNNSNVTEEGFTYQNQGARLKYTEVEVQYFDNETQSMEFELITADQITALGSGSSGLDAINKFGRNRKTIKSFACTSIGQANRLGRWFLYSNLLESEIVTFTTTLEAGVIVRPSTIIAIADSMRAGVRRGGRINSVNDSQGDGNIDQIIVDDANNTDLTAENTAKLFVVLSDGSTETRSISSISGTTITVSSAFSSTPQSNSVWAIENTTTEFQIFKVVSIEEKNSSEYTITAVIHDTNKYAQVEDTTVSFNPRTITTLIDKASAPSNLSATEQIVALNNRAVSKIIVSWQPVQGVKEYLLEFQYEKDNPEKIRIARPSFELFESRLGSYKFAVNSINSLGVLSTDTSNLTFSAVGKTALPEDPSGLTIEPISDQFVRLRFNPSTSVDVIHGGTISVRHTPSSKATATFANATEIIPKLAGNATEAVVPALTGTYLIKFIDDGGRKSENAAKVIVTLPDPQPNQVILTEREDTDSPPFQGDKVNTFFDTNLDGLLLDGTLLIDSFLQDIDTLPNIDFIGPINSSGSYEFQNKVDLEGIFNLTLKRRFVTFGLLVNDLIDSRTANINSWTDFDGTKPDDVNAKLLVATTDIDPEISVSATYGQSGTTITISKTSHGYAVGDFVVINFTAGSATDGNYEIQTVPDANSFTVTASASATISSGTSCTYGANFTQFNIFANGEYTARGFKFRAELTSDDPAQNIKIEELGFEASIKRRTETVNTAIASGTSAKTVTFGSPFFTGTNTLNTSTTAFLPTIGITLEGAVSGDYFKITSVTSTQFVIEVRDSNNNFKNLNFKYTAVGFGKGT